MPFLFPFALSLLAFGAIASVEYLRNKPSEEAPKPSPITDGYTPPFLGGQCNVPYSGTLFVGLRWKDGYIDEAFAQFSSTGAISSIQFSPVTISGNFYRSSLLVNGVFQQVVIWGVPSDTAIAPDVGSIPFITQSTLNRQDGQPDNCGNLPNPNTPPSIKEDGLFSPTNAPPNEAAIVVAPALPLALVSALFIAAKAALDAAAAATATLEAVKKIAEALSEWNKLFEKLGEFLDEWEKNRPEKRRISRQTYGIIKGDGAIDFYFNGNEDYVAIQLDVVITNIPVGYGKYFAENSPYRYPYKKLGYIAFYSNTLGIISTHELEWRRTALEIPKNAVGFIYHLGLDEQIEGYAFGSFSVKQ